MVLIGAPDANYSIKLGTGLSRPDSKCVLEKINISGSAIPIISPGASIAIGIKDKPLHVGFCGDDYIGLLRTIKKRHFVFYDTRDRRAYLVDGLSTVLHLLRAYLKDSLEDGIMGHDFIYCEGDIEEASPGVAYTGARAAYEVLGNDKNQRLPLYANEGEEIEERVTKLGAKLEDSVTTLKATRSHFTLKERVKQICHVLLQTTAYHDDLDTQAGFGWRIKVSPHNRVEGFECVHAYTTSRYSQVLTRHMQHVLGS